MAKQDTTRFSKGASVKAKPTMVKVQGKEVQKYKVDSAKRANPALGRALGRALGKVSKGSGGMDNYRDGQADLVNAALRGKKK